MKRNRLAMTVALAVGLTFAVPTVARADSLELNPGFESVTRTGTSGGSQSSGDCGFLPNAPNHELYLGSDFSYLRLSVAGNGQPTLLVVGEETGDRFCARNTPEQSGYWPQGTYRVYIGDLDGASQPYTLSISENP